MNSIFLISPYRHRGMWVFDDPERGLVREPFVAGADTVIDLATQQIPRAHRGFNLLFSDNPFPGAQIELKRKGREDKRGNTYRCKALGLDAWLCPALYKYYAVAPKAIHAQFLPMNGGINKQRTNEESINHKTQGNRTKPRLLAFTYQPEWRS